MQTIKVREVKRHGVVLTVIYHLNSKEVASTLKKRLGCGGAVKGDDIELQGSKVKEVTTLLQELGYKPQ